MYVVTSTHVCGICVGVCLNHMGQRIRFGVYSFDPIAKIERQNHMLYILLLSSVCVCVYRAVCVYRVVCDKQAVVL